MSEAFESELRKRLVEVLAGIGFHDRYLGYCAAVYKKHRAESTLRKEDFANALAATPWAFRYRRSENFFQHVEEHERIEVGLHVCFRHGSHVELILVAAIDDVHVGSVFPSLAQRAARLTDPSFELGRDGSALIHVTDKDELADAAAFIGDLYGDMRTAILAHDWPAA